MSIKTMESECKNLHSNESILKLKIVETILKLCHLFGQMLLHEHHHAS